MHTLSDEEKVMSNRFSFTSTLTPQGSQFRYGPVWLKAVKNSEYIALKESNRAKLEGTAKIYDITYDASITSKELCELISPKINL